MSFGYLNVYHIPRPDCHVRPFRSVHGDALTAAGVVPCTRVKSAGFAPVQFSQGDGLLQVSGLLQEALSLSSTNYSSCLNGQYTGRRGPYKGGVVLLVTQKISMPMTEEEEKENSAIKVTVESSCILLLRKVQPCRGKNTVERKEFSCNNILGLSELFCPRHDLRPETAFHARSVTEDTSPGPDLHRCTDQPYTALDPSLLRSLAVCVPEEGPWSVEGDGWLCSCSASALILAHCCTRAPQNGWSC
ncbi:hypothetical protein AV530_016005 [Patagioenas fasciata monilis]|uniref:Uncharacterized protein n=1 Tax=Patagioenas fasciata monilis TaxID=372326 RepID=A0A1V4KJN3_PATFA|nr:hypothetical protein AV530_016005 [Patagioenas fasciata monilis]